MNHEYTIEKLEHTFMEHAEKSNRDRKEHLEKFKINYPDSEIPSHLLNDFNIAEALYVICKEINSLKEKINE